MSVKQALTCCPTAQAASPRRAPCLRVLRWAACATTSARGMVSATPYIFKSPSTTICQGCILWHGACRGGYTICALDGGDWPQVGKIFTAYLCGLRGAAYAFLLCLTAPVVAGMALVTDHVGYIVERMLIGWSLAAFVICQFWSSMMFSPNVVGTANAIVGGWGNAGAPLRLSYQRDRNNNSLLLAPLCFECVDKCAGTATPSMRTVIGGGSASTGVVGPLGTYFAALLPIAGSTLLIMAALSTVC